MRIKNISAGVLALALTTSCVSKKVYTDLENKYAGLKKENRQLSDENTALTKEKNALDLKSKDLQTQLDKLKAERDKLATDYAATKNSLDALKTSYSALEKDSSAALDSNVKKNRELLAQLEAKEKALAAEQERLNKLSAELKERSARVDELEGIMSAQQQNLQALKDKLSKALNSFEGKGLTVEQKNGKVYVSMENKLLFGSGSWVVGPEGKKAVVEVGKVLADNPDITVLIEGHTDNVPYQGGGQINNNWDLSTKRATAIVNIIQENKGVDPKNLTAAGRSEYSPIADNATAEGKGKNRRIEIILTPKLDEISKLLNEL
ncbi:cell envelope biogenesis protein OmpA [Flavobacterium akiainvivens]|uniref:Cell envelope biogenesis protein OmpA n=1 Tax=Flavobacterium akiainvivens TaxID=1202724 RepID=A0A0M9VJ11_9FLAO|nr:OmpA family protein [Flavobacterium akiainvivens]KOS07250.1 cell envelope biogenesis protein OmpA [Flavobacterium akiainvivens]SFQ45659.1 chemotaxis protein MotB [Flavobacterium akiainvivens]